jgi:murein DD-endopeptidase MepM/ murein hydrolase activator NlpD
MHYLVVVLLMGVLFSGIGYIGYWAGQSPQHNFDVSDWKDTIHQQQLDLTSLKQEADASVEALSSRLGLMQAHVNRIDALGQKLIQMAKIDNGEFDFNQTPALGGPEVATQTTVDSTELHKAIDQLSLSLSDRENQLAVLEDLLLNRNLLKEVQPSGRPITSGWLSSYYGMRNHPISGKKEMHKGIDFAGKMGGEVIAVAKGVVTFAGTRYGYGKVVDINHGNGYTTRYGHNSKLLVSVGDTVEKGFQIAEIGSSGRSTGPHVHFEVLKNGNQVNPMKFINASN